VISVAWACVIRPSATACSIFFDSAATIAATSPATLLPFSFAI
jgi:hypothetical protein